MGFTVNKDGIWNYAKILRDKGYPLIMETHFCHDFPHKGPLHPLIGFAQISFIDMRLVSPLDWDFIWCKDSKATSILFVMSRLGTKAL